MNKLNQLHPGQSVSVYSAKSKKEHERILMNNRNIQQFSNLSFGSSDIVLEVPWKYNLVDGFYVSFELPQPCTIGPVPAYRSIRQIRYNLNGSTIYQQEGIQVMIRALDQCETKEKRDALMRAAGGVAATRALTATEFVHAFIPLPWSHIRCSDYNRLLSLDGSGGNLRVYISLRDKADIFTVVPTANALVSARYKWRMGKFMNVKDYMTFGHGKFYRYPFTNWQSREYSFTGVTSGSGTVRIDLQGFRNAMCNSIYIAAIETSDLTTNKNQLAFQELSNIRLELNGETLFRTDNTEYRLGHLFHNKVPDEMEQPAGTLRPYYNLQISKYNSKQMQESASNSGRNFSGQDLVLNFNTSTTNAYTLVVAYLYNAMIVEDGMNAQIFL